MIEFGGCDENGYRSIRLVSELDDAPEGTLIQWYLDGQPFGAPMLPGAYVAKVPGDGQVHYIELHIVGYERGGDAERVKFPSCERETVEADIRHIQFLDCDEVGNRPIRLVPQIAPADAAPNVVVQWYIDGKPIGQPGPPAPLVDTMPADGKVHGAELRVLEPENGRGDSEEFELPACDQEEVVGQIRSVDFADCDEEGNRPLRLVPVIEPASSSDTATIQWYLDGKPLGQPGPAEAFVGSIPGDGQVHTIELRVLAPEGARGDTQRLPVPACFSQQVSARIEFAGFDDTANGAASTVYAEDTVEDSLDGHTEATIVSGQQEQGLVGDKHQPLEMEGLDER